MTALTVTPEGRGMIFQSEAGLYLALALAALVFVAGLVAGFRVGRWLFALGLVVLAVVLPTVFVLYLPPKPNVVFLGGVQAPPPTWAEVGAAWTVGVGAWPFTLGAFFGTMARKERLAAASRSGQRHSHA